MERSRDVLIPNPAESAPEMPGNLSAILSEPYLLDRDRRSTERRPRPSISDIQISDLRDQIPVVFLLRLGNGTAIWNQKALPRVLFWTNVSR